MFEPGWNLIDFIDKRPEDPKQVRSSPAQTHSHFLWNAKLPYNHCWDIIFFSNLNLHGGYIYVWAGLKPDWFHWQASRGPKTIRSSPAQTHSHFLWNAKLPYNHCWDIIFFTILNLHGGYIYVWAGLKPDWFHWQASRGPKTIRSSPAQTHSHFLWNAKLPNNHCWDIKFFLHFKPPWRLHLCLSRAETWLISLTSVQGTQNNSIQPGSDPFPIFYGTPNFPITIVETLNFFSILNLHGGYIYVWAGLKPDWFHWQASRGPKTIRSSPAQTHSHFLWNAKLPYNHCWDTIFLSILNLHGGYIYVWAGLPDWFHWQAFKTESIQPGSDPFPFSMERQTSHNHCWDGSILNLHGGYIYVWAGLKPDWFHWQASRGPKTIRSSPAQTHSHFLWNAKLPNNHCWDIKFFLHFKPPWRLHLCLSRAETWLISLTSVQGPKTIRSSPAQTHSHFLWNAKLPNNHCWDIKFFLHFKPPWRLHLCLSRAETWLISLTSVQGTQNNSIQPGSDPFPFSMERQTSQ